MTARMLRHCEEHSDAAIQTLLFNMPLALKQTTFSRRGNPEAPSISISQATTLRS